MKLVTKSQIDVARFLLRHKDGATNENISEYFKKTIKSTSIVLVNLMASNVVKKIDVDGEAIYKLTEQGDIVLLEEMHDIRDYQMEIKGKTYKIGGLYGERKIKRFGIKVTPKGMTIRCIEVKCDCGRLAVLSTSVMGQNARLKCGCSKNDKRGKLKIEGLLMQIHDRRPTYPDPSPELGEVIRFFNQQRGKIHGNSKRNS